VIITPKLRCVNFRQQGACLKEGCEPGQSIVPVATRHTLGWHLITVYIVRSKRVEKDTVKSKNLLVFIVFMAVIFLVLVPYVKFVVQRQGLDADLARISLDYSTMGRAKFEERVDRICRKARLFPGSYQVDISEDKNSKRVSVEIRYEVVFSVFFFPRHEQVVLRNDFYVLDL